MSHYKPHQVYKDSGIEWLGEVPVHWSQFKVGRNVPFSIGWTPPTGDATSYGDDCAWVCISDLGPETIAATAKGLSNKAMFAKGAKPLPIGTLLFSFKLTVGTVSFLGIPAVTNEAIAAFLPVKNLDLKFFYYAAPNFIPKYGRENIYGALLLNQELIQSAKSYFPPLEEQRSIAAHLDHETARIDGLVSKKTRFIELLHEKRQALITHTVTKGLDPNVTMKDSGVEWLGEVPEHWEVKSIKYLTTHIGSGKTPSGGAEVYQDTGVIFLRSQNVHDDGLRLNDVAYISEEIDQDMQGSRVSKGDALLNITGASIGRSCLVAEDIGPANVNQHVCIVRTAEMELTRWISEYFLSAIIKAQIDFSQNGAGREGLNFEQIGNMIIALPPLAERRSICSMLMNNRDRLDTLISKTERSIELLKERRSALITAAVTGQIDVRDDTARQDQLAA